MMQVIAAVHTCDAQCRSWQLSAFTYVHVWQLHIQVALGAGHASCMYMCLWAYMSICIHEHDILGGIRLAPSLAGTRGHHCLCYLVQAMAAPVYHSRRGP